MYLLNFFPSLLTHICVRYCVPIFQSTYFQQRFHLWLSKLFNASYIMILLLSQQCLIWNNFFVLCDFKNYSPVYVFFYENNWRSSSWTMISTIPLLFRLLLLFQLNSRFRLHWLAFSSLAELMFYSDRKSFVAS